MPELIKQAASLAVLRIRLSDAVPSQGAPGSMTVASPGLSKQFVVCELEVTGAAKDRGLALPAGQLAAAESKSTETRIPSDAPLVIARLVGQWSFSPEEIQLPTDFTELKRVRYRPSLVAEVVAKLTKAAVTKVFKNFTSDALERFAAAADWLPSGKPSLPSSMLRELNQLLKTVMRNEDSLWIEFHEPAGYLPLLPWEEMLQPTSAPILRLSPHSINGLSPDSELSVVLCFTAPTKTSTPTPNQVRVLADAIREALPDHSKIHVFADDVCFEACSTSQIVFDQKDDRGRSIRLHAPDGMRSEELHGSAEPWMNWILKSLEGAGADIVHCVAGASLLPDQPRLLAAREASPIARADATGPKAESDRRIRYITAVDHSEFLTSLGAWAAILSGPVSESQPMESRLALRLFAHQIATVRPGVSVYHDLAIDSAGKAIKETYRFFIGDPSIRPADSPSVAVYCHPARATQVDDRSVRPASPLMYEYAKLEETVKKAIDEPGPLPAWVATTQRLAEETISSLTLNDEVNADDPRVSGIASALNFIEQAVAKQMNTNAPEPKLRLGPE